MKFQVLQVLGMLLAIPGVCLMFGFAPRRPVRTHTDEVSGAGSGSGALVGIDSKGNPIGNCPLKHTDVKAEISGFIARVNVVQEFQNTFEDKIEAVYTFPLPSDAAVDNMTMLVGDRKITGLIKRREEARQIFEQARRQGHTAGLLDQERPNIFTQSVTNIPPGQTVKIEISYVEMLPYDSGTYSFTFPMVVAPRYIPAQTTDADRITPPVIAKGVRAGHDISLEVTLDAGVPLDSLECITHPISLERPSVTQAKISLKNTNEIPNKDFVLKYDVLGKKIQDAVLTHHDQRGGYFTLMLTPPERPQSGEIVPKEIVFVVDTSGSMHGFPLDKSKEVMDLTLSNLNPRDTFNVITFSGEDRVLWPHPVQATRENIELAKSFVNGNVGSGGTEMMKAIRSALDPSDSQDHIRIACFMTDGEVGNDFEIIAEVKKHPNARVFAFGIGSSVNHFLLDNMAKYGRGEVEYVGLNDDGHKAANKFYERVRTPVLTDIHVDWHGLAVTDVYPARIQDLFAAKPLVITGRYSRGGNATIRLQGRQGDKNFVREIPVSFSENAPQHDVLATLWARTKVSDLMSADFNGLQRGNMDAELKESITKLGLDYRLMTQFTSFVAVEDRHVVQGGQPRVVEVPVEMPEGMSYEGVYGQGQMSMSVDMAMPSPPVASGTFFARKSAPFNGPVAQSYPTQTIKQPIPEPMTPAPKEVKAEDSGVRNKLHPAISALLLRLESNGAHTAAEAKFVKNGKAELQVWVADASPAALAALQKLGIEIIGPSTTPNQIRCRIALSKLAALSQEANVRYIAPIQ